MSNTTKEQLEQNIANMEAELQQMHSTLADMDKPKSRVVKPEKGDTYWSIRYGDGKVESYEWGDDVFDNLIWNAGNAYHTKEAAEETLAKQRMSTKILRRIEELNDGWTPDWADDNQRKYCLCHTTDAGFEFHNYFGIQYLPDEFYLKNHHAVGRLLSEFTAAELKQGLL